MKARILGQPAMVYHDPGPAAVPFVQLPVGLEIEIGGIKKKDGKSWVGVTLPNGQSGFVSSETRVYLIKQATLLQDAANVHTAPHLQAPVAVQFRKNASFYLTDTVKADDGPWVRIRDAGGLEGYIPGSTKIRTAQGTATPTRSLGTRNMLYGGLWCVGGTVVTVGSLAASSHGGTGVIAWGAIIFGGVQFFRGVGQYMTAKY